jgi:hypothetical protein
VTHAQPTRPGNRPGFRVITLAAIAVVVAGLEGRPVLLPREADRPALDIFRDYHSPPGSNSLGDLPLNGDEMQLARRPGTYIDVNWKPAATTAKQSSFNQFAKAVLSHP